MKVVVNPKSLSVLKGSKHTKIVNNDSLVVPSPTMNSQLPQIESSIP
jgi:hypothetical protein